MHYGSPTISYSNISTLKFTIVQTLQLINIICFFTPYLCFYSDKHRGNIIATICAACKHALSNCHSQMLLDKSMPIRKWYSNHTTTINGSRRPDTGKSWYPQGGGANKYPSPYPLVPPAQISVPM